MKKYIPKDLETKWQQKWAEEGTYKTDLSNNEKEKYYVLAEFTYPSGDLHVGHWFTFAGADIFARFKRMQGYNVFFPNGFDSFGLPAEGAAIKRGIHPKDWTESNIEKMKAQFSTLGASFDFYGDLATHKLIFYRWNQWIFLKMLEKGLAYRGKYLANWCPFDQTVLANEAVEAGKCWRCGTEVIQKEVEQWFFKLTEYADRLLWDEKPSVDWPKSVREAQSDWIGKSEGAKVKFKLESESEYIEVFTTRLDTIFGATFLVISPEHEMIPEILKQRTRESNGLSPVQDDNIRKEVASYIEKAQKKSELERKENKEKTGVFTGGYVINPATSEKVPVWIADYVLPGYGTGAIMAVPAHDNRDFEFAEKFSIPIKKVVETGIDTLPTSSYGKLIDSGEFSGLDSQSAKAKIMTKLGPEVAESFVTYHIHDWSIGRQRYWGTPIPVIHCDKCGVVPVPEKDLPVELPYEVDYQPKGKAPLASNESWYKVNCPNCGGVAQRDPDTMDTFVDSSWYYWRYISPDLETELFDIDLSKKIMPVDIYFGGGEHTLGHTLYARFMTKVFHDLGLTNLEEFAQKRVNHGIVLGPDGAKMSKSKGNVVNPDEEVKTYGTDAVRTHVAFFMPYDGVGPWISERIWGPYRFLERVWGLFEKVGENKLSPADLHQMHKTINKVGKDIQEIKFNTAISALMEWINYLEKKNVISEQEYKTLLKLLAPFAPHITEELWQLANRGSQIDNRQTINDEQSSPSDKPFSSIHLQEWPEVDEKYLVEDEVTIAVQINGKVRDTINVESSKIEDRESLESEIMKSERVQKFLEGKEIKKTIYIPGKIFSIVV